jgi:hypothetical protein
VDSFQSAREKFDALVQERGWGAQPGAVNEENLPQWCESVTEEVYTSLMLVEDESVGIQKWNEIFSSLLNYAYQRSPVTTAG